MKFSYRNHDSNKYNICLKNIKFQIMYIQKLISYSYGIVEKKVWVLHGKHTRLVLSKVNRVKGFCKN